MRSACGPQPHRGGNPQAALCQGLNNHASVFPPGIAVFSCKPRFCLKLCKGLSGGAWEPSLRRRRDAKPCGALIHNLICVCRAVFEDPAQPDYAPRCPCGDRRGLIPASHGLIWLEVACFLTAFGSKVAETGLCSAKTGLHMARPWLASHKNRTCRPAGPALSWFHVQLYKPHPLRLTVPCGSPCPTRLHEQNACGRLARLQAAQS